MFLISSNFGRCAVAVSQQPYTFYAEFIIAVRLLCNNDAKALRPLRTVAAKVPCLGIQMPPVFHHNCSDPK